MEPAMRPGMVARCFATPFAATHLRLDASLRASALVRHLESDQDVAAAQAPVVAPAPCLDAKRDLPFGRFLKQALAAAVRLRAVRTPGLFLN
jgi:hypothetical protein